MAAVLTDVTIRRRDVRVKLDWLDLEALVKARAMEVAGLTADDLDGVNVEVKMDQETRGSPSYRVGEWSAIVEVKLPVE